MSTPEVTLKSWANTIVQLFKGGSSPAIEFIAPVEESEPTVTTTGTANTISVPRTLIHGYVYQEYQSIRALKGKYEDSPFMENFLKNIEEYNRELIDSVDE